MLVLPPAPPSPSRAQLPGADHLSLLPPFLRVASLRVCLEHSKSVWARSHISHIPMFFEVESRGVPSQLTPLRERSRAPPTCKHGAVGIADVGVGVWTFSA